MNKELLKRYGITEKEFKRMFMLLAVTGSPKNLLIALRKAALLKTNKRGIEL